jgi:alternate signal-mediated exported protein
MNKLLKGSIAGAAGIALLLGGAGTFALWNDDATVNGGTITAGTLTVTEGTGATDGWSSALGGEILDIDDFQIVPGDVLTYITTLDITAEGDNLSAILEIDDLSIVSGGTAADDALAALLTESATVSVDGSTAAATQTISPEAGTQVVTVAVELTFPDGLSTADNEAMSGSVSLESFDVTLTQD